MNIKHITYKTQLLALIGILVAFAVSMYGIVAQVGAVGSTSNESYKDGAGGNQRMTVTYAKGENNPAIIFVPGGGWLNVDRSTVTYTKNFQDKVAGRGYTAFVIDYRVGQSSGKNSITDLKNAIKYVRDNAAKYKINPNRIALWGDSAGAGTVMRTAAKGNSGVAAVVGWSTPTNAFRDLFYNPITFLDGMWTSQCAGNVVGDVAPKFLPFYNAAGTIGQDAYMAVIHGQTVPLGDAVNLATQALSVAGIDVGVDLPSIGNAISIGPNGVTVDQNKLNEAATNIAVDQLNKALQDKVSGLDANQLVQLGNASVQLTKSVSDQIASGNGVSADTILAGTTLLTGMNDVLNAVMTTQSATASTTNDSGAPTTTTVTVPDVKGTITKDSNGRSVYKDPETNRESTFSIDGVMSLIEDYWDGKATLQEVDNLSTAYAAQPDSYIDYKNASPLDLDGYNKAIDATKAANKGNSFGSANWNPDLANKNAEAAQAALASYVNYYQANHKNNTPILSVNGKPVTDKDSAATAINDVGSNLMSDINPQNLSAATIAGCMDEFITMSPALFASPRTPPTFLAQGTADPLVPLDDAYQMRDKLRSMGIRSDVSILKNGQHMGYDARAVEPTFKFLDSILHPINKS